MDEVHHYVCNVFMKIEGNVMYFGGLNDNRKIWDWFKVF